MRGGRREKVRWGPGGWLHVHLSQHIAASSWRARQPTTCTEQVAAQAAGGWGVWGAGSAAGCAAQCLPRLPQQQHQGCEGAPPCAGLGCIAAESARPPAPGGSPGTRLPLLGASHCRLAASYAAAAAAAAGLEEALRSSSSNVQMGVDGGSCGMSGCVGAPVLCVLGCPAGLQHHATSLAIRTQP